ncbi:MAG: serine/threonine-protein phosphatase [Alphaproteobacteria bacterium]|nr:serine/threonine-protein phosphatase [Alphaproteobacteria bacterium]
MPELELALRAERGPIRTYQEDAALLRPELGLLMVADGAGGNQPADRVGPFVLQHVASALELAPCPSRDALEAAILDAEQAYRRAAEADIRLRHAGCTLAAAWLDPATGRGWIAHVGDCRAWLWRRGQARQLTVDQTLVQRLVEMGRITESEREDHPYANILLRSLCVNEKPDPIEITEIQLEPGDRVLLCTDGVRRAATAERLGEALTGPVAQAAERLMQEGLALDGSDNAALALAAWG